MVWICSKCMETGFPMFLEVLGIWHTSNTAGDERCSASASRACKVIVAIARGQIPWKSGAPKRLQHTNKIKQIFTPLRVGWPPTPQVYFGPWEGLRVVFPPWGLFRLRSFNKKSFQNMVFDSVFPMFPVKQTVIYTFFAIKAVNPSKTLLLTVFL